ncbi:MAG TPA: hypothetical protein VFA46_03090 [Actinomycetes bacterium]|nr:hypothetical protein [Actinomycetes bacterium]
MAVADRLEAAGHDDADTPPPTVEEVAALVTKLAVLLHAYAQRMQAATTAGTYQDLIRARTGSSTSQQMVACSTTPTGYLRPASGLWPRPSN